ncbi:hypothetical protein IW261DRAFT_1571622 [Armillaria novae-zelandiae]|uniref:Uncharacterized protein n=1 Tax=Armillaria novae-zelandiae TaxID=153914 RepID=A0AA39NUD6_9AGAR|nr:hypothetical protein IW261DRAFT_1571622 [Armillaria novae-zelandiae]
MSLWFTFLLFLMPSFALNITVPSIMHTGEQTTLYLFFLKKFYEQNGQSLLWSEAVWVNNFTRNVNAFLRFNENGLFTIHAYATSETSEATEYTATAIATSSGGCAIPVGAIIGVTIVSVIFLTTSALLLYLFIRDRKERAQNKSDTESSLRPPHSEKKGDHDVKPERVARPTLAPHPRSVRNSLISLEARQAALRDLREQIGSLRRSLAGAFKSESRAEYGERLGHEKSDSIGSQFRLWVDRANQESPPPEYLSHRSSVGISGG